MAHIPPFAPALTAETKPLFISADKQTPLLFNALTAAPRCLRTKHFAKSCTFGMHEHQMLWFIKDVYFWRDFCKYL